MGPSVVEDIRSNVVEVPCSRKEESANGSGTMGRIITSIPGVLSLKKKAKGSPKNTGEATKEHAAV